MRHRFTIADLRMHLTVRLAVAPRALLRTLWTPQARPHERDAARDALVAHLTHGWDSLQLDALGPEMPTGAAPPTRALEDF